MRRFFIFIVLAVVAAVSTADVRAARDPLLSPIKSEMHELIVLEIEDCPICSLVRTQIAPAYARTPRAAAVPMRFVDLNRIDQGKMQLSGPVTVLPTILLMRNGTEIDRITGYLGPENFLQMVRTMIGPTELE
jgi:thioredoxin-related protein